MSIPLGSTALTVVDRTPPEILPECLELWPVFAEVIECDGDWRARLLWAKSDEPGDDKGDGYTEPEIEFLADQIVEVRAERDGSATRSKTPRGTSPRASAR